MVQPKDEATRSREDTTTREDNQHSECMNQSVSTIHHALRASRRRHVIILVAQRALSEIPQNEENASARQVPPSDFEVTVRQLAHRIVSIEQNIPEGNVSGEPYHNVYTSLIQTHLPRLDKFAVIAYDSNRKTVSPDRNLIALATVATITPGLTKLLFQQTVADLYFGGPVSPEDSISD